MYLKPPIILLIPGEGQIQTFPFMHEQVMCLIEAIGKGLFDTKNCRVSDSVLVGRGNQKVFSWNAFEMTPESRKSQLCPHFFTGTFSTIILGSPFCHYISFPTFRVVSQDNQKSS